ncbi:flagellar hook-basal body complex protein [Alphaproteobacteria bacterium]|nr:flagellar hook-basal body complex protein [Alphaproteobacteria bacterium]
MSFYTALTGLNGSQADISATSNNIANVGTTGFKRSRAEFGDIFATSPLQNASSSIGSGTILKGIKQQFTQGNISSSLNALDLAISGQGFFTLKPSLTSAQKVYTRNGSLNVNNDRYVVDSAGQYLLVYPVNDDGSVTAKDLDSALPLQLPVTSGDPQATSNISLGVNVPAAAEVVTDKPQFADGYAFDAADPDTFTNSTSITIFDDLGNPTIATMYFIKTQAASQTNPTNKYDTRLVINDTVIDPDLVPSVDDAGNQIFIDRFGRQTTEVPDDNYFLEGKGSPLYKLDDLQTLVPSQPAKVTGERTEFDFGEEGDRLVEIVTDPTQFNATRESGDAESRVYWGKNFLSLNVDNGDQPVNIDIRPGKYNASDLAAEVQRAINEAYGDDSKIQVVQNVDDTVSINLFKLNADGSSTGLTTPISVDLLGSSYVTDVEGISLTGASPDFTREQFLAHTQAKINEALNDYAVDRSTDVVDGASALGVSDHLFARSVGSEMDAILTETQIVNLKHLSSTATSPTAPTAADVTASDKFLVYSYQGKRPSLSVYDNKTQVNTTGNTVVFDSTQNTMTINFAAAPSNISINEKIRIGGEFAAADAVAAANINGREFTVSNVSGNSITINTTGLSFPDDGFTLTETDIYVMSDQSEDVEAFFEGAESVYEGADVNFSSEKIVIREKGTDAKHWYTNKQISDLNVLDGVLPFTTAVPTPITLTDGTYNGVAGVGGSGSGATFDIVVSGTDVTARLNNAGTGYAVGDTITIQAASISASANLTLTVTQPGGVFQIVDSQFDITQTVGANTLDSLDVLGLVTTAGTPAISTSTDWVDERAPAIKVTYDEITQRLQYTVDRTVLGTGTESNFNSFSVFGATTAEETNNLGIPTQDDAEEVLIRGGEVLSTEPFVADGEEIQLNDKRYGVTVQYNSDTQTFTFASGSTGELIAADGALGVSDAQSASNITVGRYSLSEVDGSVVAGQTAFSGDNHLLSVGVSKTDAIIADGRGLASTPASAVGDAATENLSSVFRLTNTNGENVFNVSVNGISGVIELPTGFYVGSTLAEALQSRINQIQDPVTGDTVGGVTVKYDPQANSFSFVTGTTGDSSTIKVKGDSRFGLDEVPLGVGTVPEIYNLVQARNEQGVALYVNAQGDTVTTPPNNIVDGYYPLYLDEGELTFDNAGKLVSPKNRVHYERAAEGVSINLDIDFGQSTQFAQPFSVLSVEQDGFTSGRLDGLEIDASGTIRANYTNGQNNPLGKIVLANFNNQNGLKQIGNATYVETAVSGAAQVGEAGSEGYGNILSGSLERSNVDITEELVNLITAQRNFQASAKAIETTTTLTTTIINIR